MISFISYWISIRPVRYHPYLPYTITIFNPTGETSSVMFGYYFNPTDYNPMSNPLTNLCPSWVKSV
ncbi:MAG: hypothetical protein ACPG21_04075 [Crocinitomicaceae bacterium]